MDLIEEIADIEREFLYLKQKQYAKEKVKTAIENHFREEDLK